MNNIIKLTVNQYNKLAAKVLNCPEHLQNRITKLPFNNFSVELVDDYFYANFKYDPDTQILRVKLYDVYGYKKNKESIKSATFTTDFPVDIIFNNFDVTDITWDEDSDPDLVAFYEEEREKTINLPDYLKPNYVLIFAMFDTIAKALVILPDIFDKQEIDTEIELTPEGKLLQAIFGKKLMYKNIYTISTDISKYKYSSLN